MNLRAPRHLAVSLRIGGGAFLLAGLCDAVLVRTALSSLSAKLAFVISLLALMMLIGAGAGAVLGMLWRFVGTPPRLAALCGLASLPLGIELFSGDWIARRVSPAWAGAGVSAAIGIVAWLWFRRARPHPAWALPGVLLYLVDSWVWRPLYPAAHTLIAGAYLLCFALASAWWFLRQANYSWARVYLLLISCGIGAFALTRRNDVRFALIERTNAARKWLTLSSFTDAEPRFLHRTRAAWASARPSLAAPGASDTIATMEGANLILISIDALREDRVHATRDGAPLMPNLARLTREAVVFERAYAQAPHSAFSLASLMTSDYVHSLLGLRTVRPPSIAEVLRPHGYQTTAIYSDGVFFTGQARLGVFAQAQFGFDDARIATRDANETTLEVLDALGEAQLASKPLFLWAHYFDPHEPYNPPRKFRFGKSPTDLYDGEVAHVDAALPRLFRGLATLDRPSVLVITADHGEEFGEHGGVYHGSSLYEEQVRVPLIVAAPGLTARKVSAPVGLIDIGPTLLRLLGVPPAPSMLGDDMGDLLLGVATTRDRPVFSEVDTMKMVISAHHKLIYDWRRHTWQLYDLQKDPRERWNIYDEAPEVAKRLRGMVYAWHDRLQAVANDKDRPAALDLGVMGDLRAVPDLARLAQNERAKPAHRMEACRLLSKLQDRSVIDDLWKVTRSANQAVRDEAVITLGELFEKRARDALAALAQRREETIALRAAIALAKLSDSRAAPVLAKGLRASDPDLRLRATRYLGWVGSEEHIGPLLEAANDLRLRAQAVLALGRIGSRKPSPEITEQLTEYIANDPYDDVRNYAIVALGYVGDPAGIEATMERLRDGERRWSAETLVRLGALSRGILAGVDFSSELANTSAGILRCTEKKTYDVEDYLGATHCEVGPAVTIHTTLKETSRAILLRANTVAPGAAGAEVAVSVNQAKAATFTLSPGWAEYHLPIGSEPGDIRIDLELKADVPPDVPAWAIDHVLLVP